MVGPTVPTIRLAGPRTGRRLENLAADALAGAGGSSERNVCMPGAAASPVRYAREACGLCVLQRAEELAECHF